MKKLLILSLILLSFSCKKECECTQTTVTDVNPVAPGYPKTSISVFNASGSYLKSINNTVITETSNWSNNITETKTTTTKCK